jgi:hypothetical protein
MSTRYPGDTQDALYMEDGTPWWYLSPDIGIGALGGTTAGTGSNDLIVRLRMKPGLTFTQSQARADAYLGNPSVAMSPTAGVVPLGPLFASKSAFPATAPRFVDVTKTFTIPQPSTDPADKELPNQPGHRCIVARVYPSGTPAPPDFQVVADQHEAQLNIEIVKTAMFGADSGGATGGMTGTEEGEPLGPAKNGRWNFLLDTAVTAVTQAGPAPEVVTITATGVAKLPDELYRQMARGLKGAGFTGTVVAPKVAGMNFDLPADQLVHHEWEVDRENELRPVPLEEPWKPKLLDVQQSKVSGCLPIFGPRAARSTAKVELLPRRVARFALQADLSSTQPGDAQAFRVEQTGADGQPAGGVLVIMVRES